MTRRVLSRLGDDSAQGDCVALYRAGARLYLRLVALQLARQAGRIPDHLSAAREGRRGGSPIRPDCFGGGGASLDLLVQDTVLDSPVLLRTISAAALEAAATNVSPGHTLSRLYETFLAFAPTEGPEFSLQRNPDRAKRQGSFFTSPALARAVVESALLPVRDRGLADSSALRVLDPAMGTGVFLLEAVQSLLRIGIGPVAQVAETCVFGFDVDALAVEVAVLSLWIETGARRHILARHLRCCDPLRDALPADAARFDLVVGNPPWGALFSPADRKAMRLQGRLPSTDSFDSFKLFLQIAVEYSRGTVGMIVPRAFLNGTSHAGTRELLLRHFAPYEVHTFEPTEFPMAVAPACSLVFGPKPGPALIAHHVTGAQWRAHHIPARVWTRDRFPLSDGVALDLLDRLCRRHPSLDRISHLYRVRDAGINYNRASIGRRILYEGATPEHTGDLPRYRGRNFTRYGRIHQGGWVRQDARLLLQPGERLYMSRETYELPEKVVFRQTADRIIATLDTSQMVMGRSVIAVVAQGGALLLPLLACLNSTLLTCLYRALAGEEDRVLPQVKVATISRLPLPAACLTGSDDEAWMELGAIARRRLTERGDCPALDHEIDRAVYTLFGITASEISALEAPLGGNLQ